MRVLLTCQEYPPQFGGGARYVRDLAHGLADYGQEVAVLAAGQANSTEIEDSVTVFRRLSGLDAQLPGTVSPELIDDTLAVIREFGPDVVHAHHTGPILAQKILDEGYPVPSAYTQHRTPELPGTGIKSDGKGLVAEHAYRSSGYGHWIAPSEFFTGRLVQAAIPTQEVTTIQPSLEYDTLVPLDKQTAREQLTRQLDYDPNSPLVYLPSVDRPRKDIGFAFDAIAATGKNIQVVVSGITQSNPKLAELSKAYPSITFVSHSGISDNTRLLLFNASDITLMSSSHEGFGLSALEAAACGTEVCVRNAPGLQEVARQTPWMSVAVTHEEMADHINRALHADTPFATRLDRHEAIKTTFSGETRMRKHLDVYRAVAGTAFSAIGLAVQETANGTVILGRSASKNNLDIPRATLGKTENWHQAAARSLLEYAGVTAPNDGRYAGDIQLGTAANREFVRIFLFDTLNNPSSGGLTPIDATELRHSAEANDDPLAARIAAITMQ